LLAEFINGFFPDTEQRDINAWIFRTFTVKERVIDYNDVKAKAEFLGMLEDNTLKTDFQGSYLATLRRKDGF
jgi:hypothetical protein